MQKTHYGLWVRTVRVFAVSDLITAIASSSMDLAVRFSQL
uniref:Uncharacterized protein n=1 Tax=Rhizophora mucronata TaxID=61149 RepID=A0A2P2M3W9_RHIMU